MTPDTIQRLFKTGIPTGQHPLYETMIIALSKKMASRIPPELKQGDTANYAHSIQLVTFLIDEIHQSLQKVKKISQATTTFNRLTLKAVIPQEREIHIINLAQALGASNAQLIADRAALRRWFGKDTILERAAKRTGEIEYHLVFLLTCLAPTAKSALQQCPAAESQQVWAILHIEELFETILAYNGDERLRSAVFRCLSLALETLGKENRTNAVQASTFQYIYRSALDSRQHPRIQMDSLSLLATLSPKSLQQALSQRFRTQRLDDDIFIRKHGLLLLRDHLDKNHQLINLLTLIKHDPSPFVRQAVPLVYERAISLAPRQSIAALFTHLYTFYHAEEMPQVRASTILTLERLAGIASQFVAVQTIILELLHTEQDTFVLRVILQVCQTILIKKEKSADEASWTFYRALSPPLKPPPAKP